MAKKKFTNKVLSFLGLEDDNQEPQDSGNYSQNRGGSTYVPESRRSKENSRAASRSIPAQGGKSNTGRRSYGNEEYADRARSSRREYAQDDYDTRSSRREYAQDDYDTRSSRESAYSSDSRQENYDWEEPRRETSRPRSRFEEEPSRPTPQPSRRRTSARPSSTIMLTLTKLEDCCDVIDELINNNTIVLTMNTRDEHTLQRASDTLAGAVYALHATMRKASESTYLLAPESVQVNMSYQSRERY